MELEWTLLLLEILRGGDKKSIVFIHGFGASCEHWRNNAGYFANAGFRVYGLDLIGFGKSEQPHSKKLSYLNNNVWSKQVADFIREIVQKNKHEKVILIGNSIGGLTAITTAALEPKLVEAVIAAPLPDPVLMQSLKLKLPKYITRLRDILIHVFFKFLPIEIIIPLIIRTNLIKKALQLAYYHSIASDDDLQKIVKQPAKRKTAARALRAMCIGMSTRKPEDTAPKLLKVLENRGDRLPALLIWGRQDKLVPLIVGKRIRKQYPWLELLVLDNTGHCPHDESPHSFNQYVLNWLKVNL